jgi:ArsR family transcriptional regulator, arsenate/arsenite/antimonite-responsive transcriptional repressor
VDATRTIEAFGALAHEHRLAIYRLLVEAGPRGMPAGAGLITQRRVSRQLFYAADFAAMNALVDYLTKNCCGGAPCGKSNSRSRKAA